MEDSPQETILKSTEALNLAEKIDNKLEKGNSLLLIGKAYFNIGKLDLALTHYQKAFHSYLETGKDTKKAEALSEIAEVHILKGDTEKALQNFNSALELTVKTESDLLTTAILNHIGNIYQNSGEYRKAKSFFTRSALIEQNYLKNQIVGVYYKRYQAFQAAGDTKQALEYFKKYSDLKDSLEANTSYKEIKTLQANYEMEKQKQLSEKEKEIEKLEMIKNITETQSAKKERQLVQEKNEQLKKLKEAEDRAKIINQRVEILEKSQKIKELLIAKQKYYIYGAALGSVLLLIIAFSSYKQYISKKKSAREMKKMNDELAKANKKLDQAARTDPLTKLSNRRDMLEKVEYEKIRAERHDLPFSLIICDIDDFKMINDTYGHETGDFVLKTISGIMKATIRKQDIVARWGGEEFLFFLPETEGKGALIVAEKLRQNIRNRAIKFKEFDFNISLTFGVCKYEKEMTLDECIDFADQCLYSGKKQGKDQVVVYN